MDFRRCSDQFATVESIYYYTNNNLYINDIRRKIPLSDVVLILIDGGKITTVDKLDPYSRAVVAVMKRNFRLNPDDNDRKKAAHIHKNIITSFTVNELRFIEFNEQLLLGYIPSKCDSGLLLQFKEFINGLTSDDIKEELLSVNIDVPKYGISGETLYVINEPDLFINRMMVFEHMKIRNKMVPVLAIFYYDEDLINMKEHILSKYILITKKEILVSVSFNSRECLIVDNDTVTGIALKNTNYRKHDIKNVMNMFEHKSYFS